MDPANIKIFVIAGLVVLGIVAITVLKIRQKRGSSQEENRRQDRLSQEESRRQDRKSQLK